MTTEIKLEQLGSRTDLDGTIPRESFLSRYMQYAEPLTNAPRIYSLASALTTIAAAIGNGITYKFGDHAVTPNLWVVLLGPTSLYRKTTALNIGKRLLHDAVPERIYPNEVTSERMLDIMQGRPCGLFTYSEFSGLLQRFEKLQYLAGMKEVLTDLFDGPPQYVRELREKKYVISSPSISILAASTTRWMLDCMKAGDLQSGFLVRFLFVPAWRRERFIAIPADADESLRANLVDELQAISRLKGMVSLRGIEPMYAEWLEGFESQVDISEHPEITGGFVSRLGQYALKIGILIEAAAYGRAGISEESLTASIRFVEHIYADTERLMRDGLADGWMDRMTKRIVGALQKQPGQSLDHSTLLRKSGLDRNQFRKVMETLIEAEIVECSKQDRARYYRLKVHPNSERSLNS